MNIRETKFCKRANGLFCVLLMLLLAPLNGYAQGNNEWLQLTDQQVQQFANNPEIITAPQQWTPVPEASVQYSRSKAVNAEFPKPEVFKYDPADKRYSFDEVTVYNSNQTELVRFSDKVRVFAYIVPNTVAALNSYAFSSDVRINMLFLTYGLRHIGYRVFYEARNINNIMLPPTVQTIGKEAFANMGGQLHNLFVLCDYPPMVEGENAFDPNVQVIVPKGTLARYKSAPGWNKVRSFKETVYLMPNKKPALLTGGWMEPTADADGRVADLGLSVKWARMNVGAYQPEEAGMYFAWGETKTKTNFRDFTYTILAPNKDMADIGRNISKGRYDAAHVQWGDGWRLPTKEECNELIEKCQWQWTEQFGVEGMLVTGPNEESIFLPAHGERDDFLRSEGITGLFWTGNIEERNGFVNQTNACYLWISKFFTTGEVKSYWRYLGHMIRPVKD